MDDQNNGYLNDFEDETVTLTLESGEEVEFDIIAVFPVGDKDYIALLPSNASEDETEVSLYAYFEDENGEQSIENIESDEEYEIVADAFDELMDDDEYELLAEDDDEQ